MGEERNNLGYAFWQNVDLFKGEKSIAEIAREQGLKYQRLKEQRSDNTIPRADYAYLIAKSIGVSVESLFTGKREVTDPRIEAVVKFLKEDEEKLASFEALFFGGVAGQSSEIS